MFCCSLVFLITHLFVLSLAVVYMTFAHQRAEIAELWPLLSAPTVGQTGCRCSSSPQANYSRLSSSTACETGPDSGSWVCSSGKNGSVNPGRWAGSNEPQRAQSQTRLTRFWSYSCQQPPHTHAQSPRSWSSQWGGCLPPSCQRLSAPEHFQSPPPAPPAARDGEKE